MEQFLDLLKQIGVFMIAAQLLLLCCGNQKFEKYIRLLTGLLVLCFLTAPLLSMTGKDFLAGLKEELQAESSWQIFEESIQGTGEWQIFEESIQETGEWQILLEEGFQKEEEWSPFTEKEKNDTDQESGFSTAVSENVLSRVQISPVRIQKADIPKIQVSGGDTP